MRHKHRFSTLLKQSLSVFVLANCLQFASAGLLTFNFTSTLSLDGQFVDAVGNFVIADDFSGAPPFTIESASVNLDGTVYDSVPGSAFNFGAIRNHGIAFIADYGEEFFGLDLYVVGGFDLTGDIVAQLLELTTDDLLGISQFGFVFPGLNTINGNVTSLSVSHSVSVPEPPVIALMLLGALVAFGRKTGRG